MNQLFTRRTLFNLVAATNQVATERLSNIRTVRMLASEDKELGAYANRIFDIWRISRKEAFAKGLMFGGFQLTGYISLTSILFYGSSLINQGLLSYGDLSSFGLYAILCAASLSNMSGFYIEVSLLYETRRQRCCPPQYSGTTVLFR